MLPEQPPAEQDMRHDCSHCHHAVTKQHDIMVTFKLTMPTLAEPPGRLEFVEGLIDALPKEWGWGYNMADWGVQSIR